MAQPMNQSHKSLPLSHTSAAPFGTSNKAAGGPLTNGPKGSSQTQGQWQNVAKQFLKNKVQSDNPNKIAAKATTYRSDEVDAIRRKLGLKIGASLANHKERIKAYQAKHNLTVDGIVGEQTLNSMGIRSGSLPK